MFKKTSSLLLIIFTFGLFFSLILPAVAATYTGLVPAECAGNQAGSNVNACGISAMIKTLINVTDLILSVTGSAVLAMFIYGGVLWIVAAGNDELIKKGKDAIIAAVIGIFIVLGSFMIINFAVAALTGQSFGDTATIFGQSWFKEQTVK
jgi:hypothetical protein